ncbi:MAG: hypothetical protein KDD44_13260, partial [Bdellovibrionales bacterium]|nr:hypothetical protein [Bdellovibrionales bacterium]
STAALQDFNPLPAGDARYVTIGAYYSDSYTSRVQQQRQQLYQQRLARYQAEKAEYEQKLAERKRLEEERKRQLAERQKQRMEALKQARLRAAEGESGGSSNGLGAQRVNTLGSAPGRSLASQEAADENSFWNRLKRAFGWKPGAAESE